MALSDEGKQRIAESKRRWWETRTPEEREAYRAKQRGPRPQTSAALKGRPKPKKPEEERAGKRVPCANCGAMIWRNPYQLQRSSNHFCSRKCSAAYQSARARTDPANQAICLNCEKQFYRPKGRGKYNNGNHYCSKECRNQHYAGERHHGWQGGRFIHEDGYVMIAKSLIPVEFHDMASQGRALEHRIVMAQVLGRSLKAWEVVHHKNGIRTDNRPENLELYNPYEHTGVTMSENHRVRQLEAENVALKARIAELEAMLHQKE